MATPALNGKQKAKAVVTAGGVFKPEVIKDVAESLGISALPDAIASALASDVEYRIQQVIEEASRFTRHAKRGTMLPSDVDEALRVLNIEPIYGHSTFPPPAFRRVQGPNPVYFVEDEEIDFDRVVREEKVFLPKPVGYTAHWLAVEGVQPLIPENPPALPKPVTEGQDSKPGRATSPKPTTTNGTLPPTPPSPTRTSGLSNALRSTLPGKQTLVKQVLSRELQLYYARLTASLLPPGHDDVKRTAALASLRHDAGLQPLLPYLVRWVAEGVVATLKNESPTDTDGQVLDVLIEVLSALLGNQSLFVEPYLHQMIPSLLSTLLTSTLPVTHSNHLRVLGSQTMARIITQYSTTYPSLAPRVVKTLLLALLSPGKSFGTREGAIRGLMGVGNEAIRKGLVECKGIKIIGEETANAGPGAAELRSTLMEAINILAPESPDPQLLDHNSPEDLAMVDDLKSFLGEQFGPMFLVDRVRAQKILGRTANAI